MAKTPRLFVPQGAALNPGKKNRDGLFVDAVVVVENTGYGIRDEHGRETPMTCLVTRVYPDEETATDKNGEQQPWTGDRPFIDAMGVHVVGDAIPTGQLGEVVILKKVPYMRDIERQARLIGIPVQAISWPAYRIVTVLDGIR